MSITVDVAPVRSLDPDDDDVKMAGEDAAEKKEEALPTITLLPMKPPGPGVVMPRRTAVLHSATIKNHADLDPTQQDCELHGVSARDLELFVQWMRLFPDEPPAAPEPPLCSKDLKQALQSQPAADFLVPLRAPERLQELYDLIDASAVLDAKSLHVHCCAAVASIIKGRQLDEVKELLTPKPVVP